MPLLVRGCRRQRSKGQLLTSKDVGSEEGMRGSGWPRGGFWSLGDMRYGPCPLIHWTLCLHQFSLPVSWDGYEDKARQHMLKIVKLWRATDYRWDSRKNLRVIPHSQYISCFFWFRPPHLSELVFSPPLCRHSSAWYPAPPWPGVPAGAFRLLSQLPSLPLQPISHAAGEGSL